MPDHNYDELIHHSSLYGGGEAAGSTLSGDTQVLPTAKAAPAPTAKSDGPNYQPKIHSEVKDWNPNQHSMDEKGSRYLVSDTGAKVYAGAADLDPGLSARLPGVEDFYNKYGSDQDKLEYGTALTRKQMSTSVAGDAHADMATGDATQVKPFLAGQRAKKVPSGGGRK